MLALRTFTPDDQLKFASLTGDFNPMHLDPLAARRTQAGAPAVYGIHSLLWLLDSIAAKHPNLPAIAEMKASFARMIYVGDQAEAVVTRMSAESLRAEVRVYGEAAVQLSLTFGPASAASASPSVFPVTRPATPVDWSDKDMTGHAGILACVGRADDMARMFPGAARMLGAQRLAALGCSTLLVGMVIPGLHSFFTGLKLTVCENKTVTDSLVFRLAANDPRFPLMRRLDIWGDGLSGSLETFIRQPPVRQASLKTVASLVSSGEFAGATALVVGGSRGLGELTAKIIAAGGGNVIATYAVGRVEAEALAAEITASGGRFRVLPYDIFQDADRQLSALSEGPTHIFYFATPAIFRTKLQPFSLDRFEEFNAFYVHGFQQLAEAALRRRPEGIGVFYPSSVAIEKRPAGMTEYAMSKAAGEILCADINVQMPQVRITVSRLPRLLTDQTTTIRQAAADDSLAVMLPLIREFFKKNSSQ